MPEWMDDNNDDDNQLSNATFEKGTFTDLSSNRQNNNSNEKLQSQISTDDVSTRGNIVCYSYFMSIFFFNNIYLLSLHPNNKIIIKQKNQKNLE